MCTFILAWRVFDGVPIVVAANRDERLDRPSRPPAVIAERPRIVAPRDAEAGGTWIGYNEHGLLAGLTNRWVAADLAGERSRGLLVRDVLAESSAEAAAAHVHEAVSDHEYDGFNLVVVDAETATFLEWDGDLDTTSFAPGVHVVVNVGANDGFELPDFGDPSNELREELEHVARAQIEDARRAREMLAASPDESAADWLVRARDVLRDHDYGFCVHRSGFGTRSSSLITIPEDDEPYFEYADGAPCEPDVTFEPVEPTA